MKPLDCECEMVLNGCRSWMTDQSNPPWELLTWGERRGIVSRIWTAQSTRRKTGRALNEKKRHESPRGYVCLFYSTFSWSRGCDGPPCLFVDAGASLVPFNWGNRVISCTNKRKPTKRWGNALKLPCLWSDTCAESDKTHNRVIISSEIFLDTSSWQQTLVIERKNIVPRLYMKKRSLNL